MTKSTPTCQTNFNMKTQLSALPMGHGTGPDAWVTLLSVIDCGLIIKRLFLDWVPYAKPQPQLGSNDSDEEPRQPTLLVIC